jgi:U3 small nucleolar RNA-associated protein 22
MLLLSFTPKMHLLDAHALLGNTPSNTDAFRDALTLLRVWANQRGYGEGARPSVLGFEGRGAWWAGLLGLLVEGGEEQTVAVEEEYSNTDGESTATTKRKLGSRKRKTIGKGLSSYQLFKVALDFLGQQIRFTLHAFSNPLTKSS